MARREVLEITCDRCGRVETQASNEAKKGDNTYELTMTFQGETHTFDDFCKRCRNAVHGYYKRIAKVEEDTDAAPNAVVTSIDPVGAPIIPKKRGFLGGK